MAYARRGGGYARDVGRAAARTLRRCNRSVKWLTASLPRLAWHAGQFPAWPAPCRRRRTSNQEISTMLHRTLLSPLLAVATGAAALAPRPREAGPVARPRRRRTGDGAEAARVEQREPRRTLARRAHRPARHARSGGSRGHQGHAGGNDPVGRAIGEFLGRRR